MSDDKKMETDNNAEAKPGAEPVDTTAEAPPAAVKEAAPVPAPTSTTKSKKRPRSPSEPDSAAAVTAAVSAASAAAAAQLSATMGWNGLYSLLSATALSSAANLPTTDQVKQSAQKSVADCPPFVHLSKTDSAPQLKVVDDRRLTLRGGMRGYRMSRATHGINQGHYYFEVLILEPSRVSEIAAALPSNVRMGTKLQAQLQEALTLEKEGKPADFNGFGGHVRLGFSNRTGDLQAPVGYDKWSYAIRDIGGSKIHASNREDTWGGETFGPGDVIGCAISLVPPKGGDIPSLTEASTDKDPVAATGTTKGSGANGSSNNNNNNNNAPVNTQNQIRFFKNGKPLGDVYHSKSKPEGGIAFTIPDGIYYPAVSLYMGASVQVNPGPHFICPPRRPAGLKLKPVSDLQKPPLSVEAALQKVQKEKVVRKPEMLQTFQELVQTEVQVLQEAYTKHRKQHVADVAQQRQKRGGKMDDLESDEFYETALAQA